MKGGLNCLPKLFVGLESPRRKYNAAYSERLIARGIAGRSVNQP